MLRPRRSLLLRDEITRYSRNILLEEVGREGQERLGSARVLLVGGGGLGSPALLYLAAAGVGHITLVEGDRLDLTNLQRQILYSTDEVGQPKAEAASRRLAQLNPHVTVRAVGERLTPANALDHVRDVDLVLDGTDNFPTRFLVNDVCVHQGLPLISAGILRFFGLILGVRPGETPCYRCLFEGPPEPGSVPSCSSAGVLGAVAGIMGSFMAAEACKALLGIGRSIMGQMVQMDLLSLEFRHTAMPSCPSCPICQRQKSGLGFDPDRPEYADLSCAEPWRAPT